MDLRIELLCDHVEAIPILVDWYRSEWEPYYGTKGPGNAEADLTSRCKRDELPTCLVALENNHIIGVVGLDLDPTTNLTPSVVGFLVNSDHRQRGIGIALLKAAENQARQLNYPELYVSTTVLSDLFKRLEWKEIGQVEFMNQDKGFVFVKEL